MNSDPASLPGVLCPINFLCSLQAESRLGTAGTFQVSNIYSLAANSSSHWNSYPHFNFQFKLRPLENIPPKVSFSEWRITLSFAGGDLVPHTSFFGKPACAWYVLLAASQMEMFWEENPTLRFLCTFSVSSQHWIIIILWYLFWWLGWRYNFLVLRFFQNVLKYIHSWSMSALCTSWPCFSNKIPRVILVWWVHIVVFLLNSNIKVGKFHVQSKTYGFLEIKM